jgi:hypothetical protein
MPDSTLAHHAYLAYLAFHGSLYFLMTCLACLAHLAHLYAHTWTAYYSNICVFHACRMLKMFKSLNLSQLSSFSRAFPCLLNLKSLKLFVFTMEFLAEYLLELTA